MLVKQLSVFMENRPGRLYKLTHALGKEGIDFVTLSIADTKDFGIVRFIARDNEKAYAVHNSAKILMRVNDTERAVNLLEAKGIKLLSEKIL